MYVNPESRIINSDKENKAIQPSGTFYKLLNNSLKSNIADNQKATSALEARLLCIYS